MEFFDGINWFFDQLLVTPLSPIQILIGKAVVPVVIGIFQATLVFLIFRNIFQIPFAGELFPLYLTLFAFCFVIILPMVLLSGFATPVANMPEILQILTYADPLRFALDSLRRIYLEGCTNSDVAFNFLSMILVAAITLPTAGYLFRNKIS